MLLQHGRPSGCNPADLGAHAGFQRQAVLQPACHRAALGYSNIVKEPVEVDVRSFGVRMPPSTRDNPNYGIMGMLHIIPPALAWLWRLIAPRGFNNPSIVTGNELKSEGVGSYWPFATGKRVKTGQPAAAPDRGQPEHPLRPDPEPAHRRLQRSALRLSGSPVSIWHATAAQRSVASTLSRHAARCSATR